MVVMELRPQSSTVTSIGLYIYIYIYFIRIKD